MVAQIAAGAWAFHNKDKLDDIVRASVKYSVQEEYGQSSMSSRTVTFDTLQKNVSFKIFLWLQQIPRFYFYKENLLVCGIFESYLKNLCRFICVEKIT